MQETKVDVLTIICLNFVQCAQLYFCVLGVQALWICNPSPSVEKKKTLKETVKLISVTVTYC